MKKINIISVLAFILIFNFNLGKSFIESNTHTSSNNLQVSGFWDLTGYPIYINGAATGVDAHNWTWFENQLWFGGGNGSITNPYIIENITINGLNVGSNIEIQNSNNNFIIRNNTVYNSEGSGNAGIKLTNVTYGKLINNTITSNNGNGIRLIESHYNEIIDNTLISNIGTEIRLWNSGNNQIILNSINGIGTSANGI